jgi:LDH2 family malate/lactate/ureidoglycolate dehydrogenase
LAVAAEILTGVLAGCFAWQIPSLYNLTTSQSIAHFMLAINVSNFVNFDIYLEQIEAFKAGIKGGAKATGISEIFLPGEIELNKRLASLTEGSLSLPEAVVMELNALASEVGLAGIK